MWNPDPDKVFLPTKDYLKMCYLVKKGQNSLVSKDGTVSIKPAVVRMMVWTLV